jgi:hypothetical protein
MNLTVGKESKTIVNVSGFETETVAVVSRTLLLHLCQVTGCAPQLLLYISVTLQPENRHAFM